MDGRAAGGLSFLSLFLSPPGGRHLLTPDSLNCPARLLLLADWQGKVRTGLRMSGQGEETTGETTWEILKHHGGKFTYEGKNKNKNGNKKKDSWMKGKEWKGSTAS